MNLWKSTDNQWGSFYLEIFYNIIDKLNIKKVQNIPLYNFCDIEQMI